MIDTEWLAQAVEVVQKGLCIIYHAPQNWCYVEELEGGNGEGKADREH